MYQERLSVPLRWWALATMFLATVLIAFLVATPLPIAVAVTVALSALTTAVFVGYGRTAITIEAGVLRAGRAVIEAEFLGAPRRLDEAATKRALGVDANARAYLLVRPYLSESVLVPIQDASDPTPYWLLMTRDPDRLLGALIEAIAVRRS